MSDWSSFFYVATDQRRGVLHVRSIGGSRRYVQDSGSRRADALGTTGASMLVSPRVLAVLDGRTGWSRVRARIALRDGSVIDDYAALRITGRSGPLDRSLSDPVMLPPAAPGGRPTPGLRGLRFDPSTWDGSDVFRPERTQLVIVTADVAEALRRAKLTNLRVEAVDDIEFEDV